jgi:hypothetical protein
MLETKQTFILMNNQVNGLIKYSFYKQAQQHFIPQYFPPQFMAGPHGVIFSGPYHPPFVPMGSMVPTQLIPPFAPSPSSSPTPIPISPTHQQKEDLGSKILNFVSKYKLPIIVAGIAGAAGTYIGKKWGEAGSLGGAFKSIWGDIKGMFKKEGE